MNPRIEKLLKLPLYQRVAMLGCLLLLLVGLAVWFLGMPLYEELEQLKAQSQKLDAEVAEKRLLARPDLRRDHLARGLGAVPGTNPPRPPSLPAAKVGKGPGVLVD